VLHSFSVKLYFAGVLFLLFFALLGLSVRAWVKKARRTSSGAAELSEAEARGSSDPPGADSPALECPNFQGRPLAQAREDLEAAGYKLGRISFIASSSSAVGVVVAQTPPPGSKVTRGTVVKFQVSITAKTGSSNF
ncbi:MAG: PASTA domain-containing protein, partial [Terriglobia bacterium]